MNADQSLSNSVVASRIALGTVQFGMSYGIANKSGQVSAAEVKSILSLARARSVQVLDTAMDYGQSEASLGANGVRDFDVITKLSAIPDDTLNVKEWVRAKVEGSLERLNMSSVKGLLLHRPAQLLGPHGNELVSAITDLKTAGLVEKIGISIYSPQELPSVLDVFPIDLVQAPFNIVDRRLADSGWLQRLYDAGIEIHTRSTFLQGLLLMPRAEIPEKFNRWVKLWNLWHEWLAMAECSSVSACLGFVYAYPQISKTVVGVDCAEHLNQLLDAPEQYCSVGWPNIAVEDEMLVNPANWNSL